MYKGDLDVDDCQAAGVRVLTWAGCQVQTWTSPLSCSDTQRGYWRSASSAWLSPRSETFTNAGWLQRRAKGHFSVLTLWLCTEDTLDGFLSYVIVTLKQTKISELLWESYFYASKVARGKCLTFPAGNYKWLYHIPCKFWYTHSIS